MPDNLNAVKAGFYNIAGIPNIFGAIDCTHVEITGLRKEIEHVYINRKRFLHNHIRITFVENIIGDLKQCLVNNTKQLRASLH